MRPLRPAAAVKLKLKRPVRLARIVRFDFLKLALTGGLGGGGGGVESTRARRMAAAASTTPPETVKPLPSDASLWTDCFMARTICVSDARGAPRRTSAATPDTCGVAIEVPSRKW